MRTHKAEPGRISNALRQQIREATANRLKMYKTDFALEMDSEPVIDMETRYIISLLELGVEELEKGAV